MWIPKTEDEIVQAITLGSLVESPTFDAKREIPASGKSKDLAKDVAAMATDGGTLLGSWPLLVKLSPSATSGAGAVRSRRGQTWCASPSSVD